MYTKDVKLSFPNNNIKKFTFWTFTLCVTVLTSFQENDPYLYTFVDMVKRGVLIFVSKRWHLRNDCYYYMWHGSQCVYYDLILCVHQDCDLAVLGSFDNAHCLFFFFSPPFQINHQRENTCESLYWMPLDAM